jgi:PadR family transcriptional regulator PadR
MGEIKSDVLQGTLDLMVLKTLESMGPLHGYGIARRIEQVSDDTLNLNQGTIYPALLRLQQKRWITAEWEISQNNRRAKYYSLSRSGKKQIEKRLKTANGSLPRWPASLRRLLRSPTMDWLQTLWSRCIAFTMPLRDRHISLHCTRWPPPVQRSLHSNSSRPFSIQSLASGCYPRCQASSHSLRKCAECPRCKRSRSLCLMFSKIKRSEVIPALRQLRLQPASARSGPEIGTTVNSLMACS